MVAGTSEKAASLLRCNDGYFMRLTLQSAPIRGLVLDHSANCIIDSLQVVNVDSDTAIGVLLDSAPGSVFRWAMVYGNYGRAFSVNRSSGSRFAHARVHGSAAEAAMTFSQSSGVKVQPCSLVCAAPASVVLGDSCNDDTLARMTMLGTTQAGIDARNCRGLVVANSCIRGWTVLGVALIGGHSLGLYYNTIVGPENAGMAAVGLAGVTDAEAKDNIIWNRGLDSSACYRITGTFPFAPGASNYNDLYASGGAIARVGDTVYGGLPGWRGHASAPDAHSLSRDPLFVVGDNFYLSSASPCRDSGIPIPGFPFDIDLDDRDTLSPDIGADEFTPGAVSEEGRLPQLRPALLVSPNPCRSSTVLHLSTGALGYSGTLLRIYDASGRLVLSLPVRTSSFVLSTSSLSSGFYIARLDRVTARFIVQR